jgi:hypothetical protein
MLNLFQSRSKPGIEARLNETLKQFLKQVQEMLQGDKFQFVPRPYTMQKPIDLLILKFGLIK